jgi:fibronectin type III domain protein
VVRSTRRGVVLLRLSFVSVLAVCAWALAAGNARAVHTFNPDYWCADNPGGLDPCVVSATYDGSALTSSDASYAVWAIPSPANGAETVQWSVRPKVVTDLSAALGHTFSITIRTSAVPRVIDAYAGSLNYARTSLGGSNYEVTVSGTPVSVTENSDCSYPPGGPTCPPIAPGSKVLFQGEIDDYNYTSYSDPSYPTGLVDSFYGMTMLTNITETGLPPNIVQVNGQNELQIDLADHHFLQDGTTVVQGNFVLEIPDSLLATYWGINDPSTLASDGLSGTIGSGGGTLAVTVVPGTGVQVAITGLTFSQRKLLLKLGHVRPRAPTHIKATRLSASSARVAFRAARPRGQRVTGYKLVCAAGFSDVVQVITVKGRRSPLRVRNLAPRKAYSCRLRARSKAGYGARSRGFSIPR